MECIPQKQQDGIQTCHGYTIVEPERWVLAIGTGYEESRFIGLGIWRVCKLANAHGVSCWDSIWCTWQALPEERVLS